MALDLGLTTRQLRSARDGVASAAVSRGRRLGAAIDRALTVASDAAAPRTESVGRRPWVWAAPPTPTLRTCPERTASPRAATHLLVSSPAIL